MVYCGRPSKGCQRCRIKRIKCNQQRPSCTQCRTANVDCSGYRNEVDLLFRDESLSVARKFVNTPGRKPQPQENTSTRVARAGIRDKVKDPNLPRDKHTFDDSILSLTLSIQVPQAPIEKAATAFLLTSYLHGSSFCYLPWIYHNCSPESLLSNAVEAVALAAFSNEVSQPSILGLARNSYARSMRIAHEIMSSPDQITADETLAAVLLLSRFETLTHDRDLDGIFNSWSKHLLGSLSIVQLRDRKQNFASSLSRKMYAQVVANFNLYRIQHPTHQPHAFDDLRQKAQEALDPSDFWNLLGSRFRFQSLTDELSDIRRVLFESPLTEYRTTLREAIAMERKTGQSLSVMAGAGLPYEVVNKSSLPSGDDSLVLYSDVYHVYRDARDAQFWNSVRMRSLALNDIVSDYAMRLIVERDQGTLPGYDPAIDEDFEQIITTCQEYLNRAIDDICNSAPQFLRSGHPDCTVGACCYLVWPLYLAARCSRDRCGDSRMLRCRSFVVDRLTWMAEHMKIPVARFAIECLKTDGAGSDWSYPYRDDFLIPFFTF